MNNKLSIIIEEDENGFFAYYNQVWDKQFKDDVISGKLDNLATKALLEYQSGEYSTL